MTISAGPRAPETTSSFHALTPLRFPSDMRLTPLQFAVLCAENREAVLELAADGQVLAMTPTGSETGGRNIELAFQLQRFARSGTGWKAFDSSTGFRLPDDSVLSPDASLVRLDRWLALTSEQRRGFAPICPDLVVELASPSDEGPVVSRPCAARWLPTRPTVPASVGCSSPISKMWRFGPPAATPNAARTCRCWKPVPSSPVCSWSLRRSGRGDAQKLKQLLAGLFALATTVLNFVQTVRI